MVGYLGSGHTGNTVDQPVLCEYRDGHSYVHQRQLR